MVNAGRVQEIAPLRKLVYTDLDERKQRITTYIGGSTTMPDSAGRRTRASSHTSQHSKEDISSRKTVSSRNRPGVSSRQVTGIAGALLVIVAICWLGWLLLHQIVGFIGISTLPLPGIVPAVTPTPPLSPLLAAGISLGHPSQTPALSAQQALQIANELEPDAAANAKKVMSEYVLLNYAQKNAAQPDMTNRPAWLIYYQQIPLQPSDPSVDPTPFPQTHHDLYVFLDANSGKELLAIWV